MEVFETGELWVEIFNKFLLNLGFVDNLDQDGLVPNISSLGPVWTDAEIKSSTNVAQD